MSQTEEITMLRLMIFIDLGQVMQELDDHTDVDTFEGKKRFYNHTGVTINFDITFDWTTIYFFSGNGIWSMGADGMGVQLLFTTVRRRPALLR